MAGVIRTERGLGDGIKALFDPIFDSLNRDDKGELLPEAQRISFPETARLLLNGVFSAGVLSGFTEKSCSVADRAAFFREGFPVSDFSVGGGDATEDAAVTELRGLINKLDAPRRDALSKMLQLPLFQPRPSPVGQVFEIDDGEAAKPVTCFDHVGTDGYVAKGLEEGEAGFEVGIPAGKVGFNINYAAKITIVGEEPKLAAAPDNQPSTDGFVPPKQMFTGEVEGVKRLTTGGICAAPICSDEWVSGVAKITVLFGIRAQAVANAPDKLKSAVPALGVAGGLRSKTVFTFDFLHYPRTQPAAAPGTGN